MQCIRFLSRLSYIGVFSRFVDMPSRPRLAHLAAQRAPRASVLARLERASAPARLAAHLRTLFPASLLWSPRNISLEWTM